MGDDYREMLSSDVVKRLGDPAFRKLLTAATPDGNRPLIPALKSDTLSGVLSDVHAAGGAGNVVVPFMNGYMVITMTSSRRSSSETDSHPPIDADCTIGVLIARLVGDGADDAKEMQYCLVSTGTKAARADLAGISA